MSTFAPSDGTTRGTRGCAAYQRSNSALLSASCAGAWAAGSSAAPSRGKNATTETAPPRNSTATTRASGLVMASRKSRKARRGKVVIGNEVTAPETRNSPTTAASVARHSTQYTLRIANDTYIRYSTAASAAVEIAKI